MASSALSSQPMLARTATLTLAAIGFVSTRMPSQSKITNSTVYSLSGFDIGRATALPRHRHRHRTPLSASPPGAEISPTPLTSQRHRLKFADILCLWDFGGTFGISGWSSRDRPDVGAERHRWVPGVAPGIDAARAAPRRHPGGTRRRLRE